MSEEFPVIIVGGSIGGLTLAHCLQRVGIKHIVLEKAANPAPQVGASIGILPNGARVLDQLQLYDEIAGHIEPLSTATITYPDGFSFTSSYPKVLNERFGFPIAFLDRQKMLDILYRNYPDHSRIRLGEIVMSVETCSDGATVTTASGAVYRGQLVVGADGVHSKVRQEIWKAIEKARPNSKIAQERSSLTAEFRCIFGISSAINGLLAGEQVNALFDGLTFVTIHGKNGRIYWFVIQKLDQKYIYPNCPRYGKDDIAAAANELRDIQIHQGLTFGKLWDSRETVSMTVLEENTFKIWHHGRLLLLGDSAHKMTPNIGQGANMAIEDAAALTNLLRHLSKSPTNAQIEALLRQYRSIRYERVDFVYQSSRFMVRFQARDGLLKTLFGRYYIPYAGKDLPADMGSIIIAGGVICDFLPPPKRCGGGWERYRRNGQFWGWVAQSVLYILFLCTLFIWAGRPGG